MDVKEFKRFLIDRYPFKKATTPWYRVEHCPFCGNSKWKFYMNIDVTNDYAIRYFCFRCSAKGPLTTDILKAMGFENLGLPNFKHSNGMITKYNEVEINESLLPNEQTDLTDIQNYVKSRVGVIPTLDELRMFMYIPDPMRYAKMLSGSNANPNIFKNRFWFKLTNGILSGRYIDDSAERWYKFTAVKRNGHGLYIINKPFDPTEPIHVCICEGVFDAIGLYYHFIDKPNTLFISVQGTIYSAGLDYLINHGIFGSHITVGIYKDGNVQNYEIKYNFKYRKLFKSITIYENTIENDFGYPDDKIEIHKSLVKGNYS